LLVGNGIEDAAERRAAQPEGRHLKVRGADAALIEGQWGCSRGHRVLWLLDRRGTLTCQCPEGNLGRAAAGTARPLASRSVSVTGLRSLRDGAPGATGGRSAA